jgi:hypothetical protein
MLVPSGLFFWLPADKADTLPALEHPEGISMANNNFKTNQPPNKRPAGNPVAGPAKGAALSPRVQAAQDSLQAGNFFANQVHDQTPKGGGPIKLGSKSRFISGKKTD